MKNILVPIDFNDHEQVLLNKAFEMAQAFNSKIWLLHIADPDPDFVGYATGPQYIRDDVAPNLRKHHKIIQEYALQLYNKGANAEALLIQGTTTETILDEAKKLNIDLIILGHHEHGFLYKLFVGSVSEGIIKQSKVPVLIVPLD